MKIILEIIFAENNENEKISSSKHFNEENVNSEKVFLIYLDKASLHRIMTFLFLRLFEFSGLIIGFPYCY